MFNVVIGTMAQCCLTILPMYLVLSAKDAAVGNRGYIGGNYSHIEKNLVE